MYENHRDNFGKRVPGREDRDWRRGEERYRREVSGAWDRDDDRGDWSREDQNAPFYSGRYEAYGPPPGQAYRGKRGPLAARDRGPGAGPAHDEDHGRPHYGAQFDRGESQQPYFTGQQSSWQVPSAQRGYGQGGYGADYRPHGYAGDDESDDRGFFDRAGDEIASWFGDKDAARRREEDHRGRGPSGYTRSDERIRDDVNDRLTEDWRVDASHVSVTVDKGEVTLDGTVTSRQAKRRAEDVVDSVSGVKHVQNNLRVASTDTHDLDRNWALNRESTAEGGVLGSGAKASDKV